MLEFLVQEIKTSPTSSASSSIDLRIMDEYIYFSGIKGLLSSALIDRYCPNAIVAVKDVQRITYQHNNDKQKHSSTLIVCGKGVDVFIQEKTQVLIVNASAIHALCVHSFGVLNNVYEPLMLSIFDLIPISGNARNEILAIANLVGIIARAEQAEPLLIRIIKNNYCDSTFDLNELCALANMSRRSVQYALKEMGTTFSHELKSLRVMRLKSLIDTPGTKLLISSLAYKSGFKNPSAANRDFYSLTNQTITQYIQIRKRGYANKTK